MIIEIFILVLLLLKGFELISLSWTVAIVISLALIIVEIQIRQNNKALLNGFMMGAGVIDDRIDDIEYQLDSKQDRNEPNM